MKCCNRLKLAGTPASAHYCDRPAVGVINSNREIREGWVIASQMPVCEHCYKLRTGESWVISDQLSLLVS